MAKKFPRINLLRKEVSVLDRIIDWTLFYGRILVIVTEFIAMSSFLYRFTLDRGLIDLHEKIQQKQEILKLLKPNEDIYRNLQKRLEFISQLAPVAEKKTKAFLEIANFDPNGFTYNSVILTQNSIRINANVVSSEALTSLVEKIKKHPNIESISVDKIDNKISSSILVVDLTANVKQ